jgi:predicted nucleotidyltransferase
MIPLIEDNREAIIDLCKQYGVRKLALFGSAARGDFDADTSDVDFVFEFLDYGPGVARRFMRFAVELEDLLQKRVDLVFESVISDPEFLDDVRSTQEVLYDAAESAEAIA